MAEDKAKKVSPKSVMTKEKPAAKKESEKKDGKEKHGKHKHKTTLVEHHGAGGGHTVRHSPGDKENEVSYAAPDLATVNAGMQQNVGDEAPQGAEPAPAVPAAPAPQPGV